MLAAEHHPNCSADHGFIPHQDQLVAGIEEREPIEGAFQNLPRRLVTAHGIDCNPHPSPTFHCLLADSVGIDFRPGKVLTKSAHDRAKL